MFSFGKMLPGVRTALIRAIMSLHLVLHSGEGYPASDASRQNRLGQSAMKKELSPRQALRTMQRPRQRTTRTRESASLTKNFGGMGRKLASCIYDNCWLRLSGWGAIRIFNHAFGVRVNSVNNGRVVISPSPVRYLT